MTFQFTSTEEPTRAIPFFEDARADHAPYYSSTKTLRAVRTEVIAEMAKLDAAVVSFREGFFGNGPRRYGYEITFIYGSTRGRIAVAGLPLRNETPAKIVRVRVQALLIVRDWLKASVTQPVFSPGSSPLMQFLLVDGERTLAQFLQEERRLPAELPAPKTRVADFVDGELN